jgi:hypothetical protein
MLDVRAIQKYFAVIVLHPKPDIFCTVATLHESVEENVLIRVTVLLHFAQDYPFMSLYKLSV